MPTPAADGPVSMPEDLDALVRAALNGGRVDQVRAALESRSPVTATGLAEPFVGAQARVPGRGHVSVSAQVASERRAAPVLLHAAPALPEVDPAEQEGGLVFDALAATAARARAAWRSGDAPALRRTLTELEATLQKARATVGEDHPVDLALNTSQAVGPRAVAPSVPEVVGLPSGHPPVVELPRYRHPWLLVVEGAGDGSKARVLADAMDVDLPTAQQAALAPYPRVALRSDARLPLDRKAGRIEAMAGLRAVVTSQDALREIGAPVTALGAMGVSRFEVVDGPAWRMDEDGQEPGEGRTLDTRGVALVVPGDVVIRKYRVGNDLGRGRGKVVKVAGERRVAVIDFHGPDCFVRVVQGVTDLRGLPGYDGHSSLRSMRGLAEKVWQWWPKARVLPPRTARPGDMPSLEQVQAADGLEHAGWAEWEEHSRMVRLLGALG